MALCGSPVGGIQPVAVVVGAGPAGVLSAVELRRRGFRVTVVERRPESRSTDDHKNSRGYPMTLSERSIRALTRAGLEVSSVVGHTPSKGFVFNGTTSAYAQPGVKPTVSYIVDRTSLGRNIVAAAQALGPDPASGGSIRWLWGHQLAGVDWDRRVASFAPSHQLQQQQQQGTAGGTSEQVMASYDLLIGADGQGSAVRAQLLQREPAMTQQVAFESIGTYKTFHGLPATAQPVPEPAPDRPSTQSSLGVSKAGSTAVSGADRSGSSRASTTVLLEQPQHKKAAPVAATGSLGAEQWAEQALPGFSAHQPREYIYFLRKGPAHPSLACWKGQDGSLSGMMTGVTQFERDTLRKLLAEGHPNLPQAWRDSIVEQCAAEGPQAPNPFGRVVRLSQFHGPRCVLVGDAAHAVTSSLGQGCNLAMESVRVLADTLDAVQGDLDALPPAFTSARLRDAHAFQTLETLNALAIGGACKRGLAHPAEVAVRRVMGKVLMLGAFATAAVEHMVRHPGSRPSPFVAFGALRDADVSFAEILRVNQARAAAAVAAAVATLAVVLTGGQAVYAAVGAAMH